MANVSTTESINSLEIFAKNDRPLRGYPNCLGIAIGTAYYISPPVDFNYLSQGISKNIEKELTLFEKAITEVQRDLEETTEKLSTLLSSHVLAIFDFYLTMSRDNTLYTDIKDRILKGDKAETALKKIIQNHLNKLSRSNDLYLRERASDLKDLAYRIILYLQADKPAFSVWYPKNSILIAEELTASMLGNISLNNIIGLVSIKGSANSHIAILAKALNIPSVMGVNYSTLPLPRFPHKTVIIDGNSGLIYVSPTETMIKKYKQLALEDKKHLADIEHIKEKPCVTLDNHAISLLLNTDLITEPKYTHYNCIGGVGLFRTETLFITRENLPSEYEQINVYREQLKAFHPRMVTMRTLDAGGDKPVKHFNLQESNPSLGWRGIRITLDYPEVFMIQIRAMLKASFGLDNLQISLPMISNMQELDTAISLINRAYSEVQSENTYFSIKKPALGLMVEVPAAAYQVMELGKKVDFISVGSNDLTQYILAVDRTNARVANLYDTYHPAVLKTFMKIVNDTHKLGKPVSICGEIAGDPLATILLIGMGFDALSMNASNLLRVKWVMQHISLSLAQKTLDTVMKLDNSTDIKKALSKTLCQLNVTSFSSHTINSSNTAKSVNVTNDTNLKNHANHINLRSHTNQLEALRHAF